MKITSEGTPAHDDQAAELPFNDPTVYPIAIDFVVDKAAELGRPAVMLLNIGSVLGPTDGTSDLARKIDSDGPHASRHYFRHEPERRRKFTESSRRD